MRRVLMLLVALLPTACGGDDGGGAVDAAAMVTDAAGDASDEPIIDAGVDATPSLGAVVINEVVPDDALGGADWIEFYNPGEDVMELAGYWFRDSDPTQVFTFPDDTILAAGEFLVVEEGGEADQFDFGLSGAGDELHLYDENELEVDMTSWTDIAAPSSWGRDPDGTGEFMTLVTQTRAASNE